MKKQTALLPGGDAEELNNGGELVVLSKREERKLKRAEKRAERADNGDNYEEEVDAFPDLALLMGMTVKELKDEFFSFQIRKLMSKLSKAVIRFAVSDKEMERLFYNAKELTIDGLVVAPAFLPQCIKQVNKNSNDFKVGVIIDFPFGESTLKSKLTTVKDCAKKGVDDITVMMPSMLICKEQVKTLKKQCAKLGKLYRGRAGVALNATDLDEDKIKLAIKTIAKTKLTFLTFVFGEASLEEVKSKMAIIAKYKGDKKVFALANVDSAEGIMALFTNGVDKILTPYADKIGEELVERFKIKNIKLK